MNSEFGLMHVWAQGDIVTRIVFIILASMSVLSWCVIIIKGLGILRVQGQARKVPGFWHNADLDAALGSLGSGAGNPFKLVAEEGREAAAHYRATTPQLHDSLDINDWIRSALNHSIDNITARLQSGLVILASVGSTAPFVGLFGTVWGIYHALMSIGQAGQASIDKVAGPIGEALIMTGFGLAVAIPAVLGYNVLVRGNKAILGRLHRFAHDLHAFYITGARVTAASVEGNIIRMKKA